MSDNEENPLERQCELMDLISQDTRHRIIQAIVGHPETLASADEINHFVPGESKKTVEQQLDVLVEADILAIYEYPPNKEKHGLPWKFYGFTESGVNILAYFNYLSGGQVMMRSIHQKTRKPGKIERHEMAPRPPLPEPVSAAFRFDGGAE